MSSASLYSAKISTQRLAFICKQHGIEHIVFSPGSRNAALVIAFHAIEGMHCHSVVDERSAGFVALGMAQQLGKAVAIACTSGSAAVNYIPAAVEAYYQGIPLLILTADRPVEWIDQGPGQSIRQSKIFEPNIKGSFEYIQEAEHPDLLWYNDRIANSAILLAHRGQPGPVHINLPFREPLYATQSAARFDEVKIIREGVEQSDIQLDPQLIQQWASTKRKIILVGQHEPDLALSEALLRWRDDPSVVVITETTSNIHEAQDIACIDRILMTINDHQAFEAEIVLGIGNALISKKMRRILQAFPDLEHWQIHPEPMTLDRYKKQTRIITAPAHKVLLALPLDQSGNYKQQWTDLRDAIRPRQAQYLSTVAWSDLAAYKLIFLSLRDEMTIHLGNSSVVRYAQLFEHSQRMTFRSNRGVSGIDGCTSTAVGAALSDPDHLHVLLSGDLSFFYDSNAMWTRNWPDNLRVIVINNGGGGIFKIIPGPDTTELQEDFFVARQERTVGKLASAYNLLHEIVSDEATLTTALKSLLDGDLQILEVDTRDVANEQILSDYFVALKK